MKDKDPRGLADLPLATFASPDEQRHRAARSCAHHARDADELAHWLDMLGLHAVEGRTNP